MKRLLIPLISLSLLTPVALFAAQTQENVAIQARINAMLSAASNGRPEVYLPADRYNTDVQTVMQLNGITREEAIARIARALIAQNGYMPKPPIAQGYGAVYNPAPHAFQQALSQMFYAGVNKTNNQPVFTVDKRTELRDSFWYCPTGQTYVYTADRSYCEL